MIANPLTKPWHLCLLAVALMGLLCGNSRGQAPPPEDPQPAVTATAVNYPPPVNLQDLEPITTLHQVDKAFGWIVNQLEATLFYKILPDERQYAQENHVVYYLRDQGTDQPFQIAENSKLRKPDHLPDQVTEQELVVWVERGKVQPSASKLYRLGVLKRVTADGEIRERPVEYAKYVINDSTKYELVPGVSGEEPVFKPVRKIRATLSDNPDEWLSVQQIEEMAKAGELALDVEANGPQTPYLFTEHVGGVPLVVIWLSGGAIFFTLYFGFVNFWGFAHAVNVVRGDYDDPEEPGEVTHFQALASALSATVGLGNIAGVTIAMTAGGPGAFFWMILCGFFGMTSKFVECALGQIYREVKPDGTILGGPMQYLVHAFGQFGLKPVGSVISILFAVMCVVASFGGGNMFQGNQAASQVLKMVQNEDLKQLENVQNQLLAAAAAEDLERLGQLQTERTALKNRIDSFAQKFNVIFGIVLAGMVALVIIGGIKRIGATAGKIVPAMCLMYVAACLYIIALHITEVPAMFITIFTDAFNPDAVRGGILGVIVIGVQRAAFSNEAGVGSAAIAHSAAKTDEPVREGFVALLEPFIDTIIVCSMTALVILITGAWDHKDWVHERGLEGVQLTSEAFAAEISWFPYVLTAAVFLFAFSTIISWSYYGERCWERMFGARSTMAYRIIFVIGVFLGPIFPLASVLAFSDIMILAMAFPNILGAILLAPTLKRAVGDYWEKYRAGEFKKSH